MQTAKGKRRAAQWAHSVKHAIATAPTHGLRGRSQLAASLDQHESRTAQYPEGGNRCLDQRLHGERRGIYLLSGDGISIRDYVGVLTLEDAAFCQRVSALLKENIGQPIAKIGDLDLPDPV